jgi:hypothetical protein
LIERRVVAIIVGVVVIFGVGIMGILLNAAYLDPLRIPPPSIPPDEAVEKTTLDGIEVWAEASYWQDFMPSIPEEGPPFYAAVRVHIINTGNTTIADFNAFRMTIYYNGTIIPLVTLALVPVEDCPQINPGDNMVIEFTNSREQIYSPSINEGSGLYSCILATWSSGVDIILTTSPSALFYTC